MSHRIQDPYGDNNLVPNVNQVKRRGRGSGRRRRAPSPAPDSDMEEYRQMHINRGGNHPSRRRADQNLNQVADRRREEMAEQQRRGDAQVIEDNGQLQSRWVRISMHVKFNRYEDGVFDAHGSYEEDREAFRKIQFRTRDQFKHGVQNEIDRFKRDVTLVDKYFKTVFGDEHVELSFDREDLIRRGRDEAHIGIRQSVPIDNRFLTGASVNRLSKKDKAIYLTCMLKGFIVKYGVPKYIPSLAPEKGGVETCLEIMGITAEKALERGIKINEFKKLCDNWKISLLAISANHQLVIPRTKHEYKSKYPFFVCYVFDAHCYPIEDKVMRAHFDKVFANRKDGGSTGVVRKDDTKKAEKAAKAESERFSNPDYKVDVEHVVSLDELSNCVVYYNQQDLKPILVKMLQNKNTLYKHKHTNHHVTCIEYDNGVWLYSNPNFKSNQNWEASMRICKVLEVEFRNQSISAVAWEHMYTYYHPRGMKTKRINPTKGMRERIIQEQDSICLHCHEKMGRGPGEIEINHITPVSCGGLTIRSNLEALHKKCHAEVTLRQVSDRLMVIDNSLSYFIEDTIKIFTQPKNGLCHNFVNLRDYAKFEKQGRVLCGLDSVKSRRSCLRYANKDDWCCFSALDYPVQFDTKKHKDIPRGFYYIESDNVNPLKGNGWYSVPMVKYCLDQEIIKMSQIKFYYKSSMRLEPHYFHRWIDKLIASFPDASDEKLLKLMVNGVVGMFGTKYTKARHMRFFNAEKAANAEIQKKEFKEQTGVDSSFTVLPKRFHMNEGVHYTLDQYKAGKMRPDYFEVTWNTKETRLENHMPIFMQILDLESIECHKISCRIENAGGIVCHINTDAVVGSFETPKQVKAFLGSAMKVEWAPGVQKYKPVYAITDSKQHLIEKPCEEVYTLLERKYTVYPDPMHDDFEEYAMKLVGMNSGGRLLAPAGCGKTTMIRAMLDVLKEQGKKFIIAAPTHVARKLLCAEGIEARTLDSALSGLKTAGAFNRFNSVDYFIVDECSMISEQMWMILTRIKQKCPNVKFWFSGDFRQLPPVKCRLGEGFNYKDSPSIHWLCDGVEQQLSVNRRGRGDPQCEKHFAMYMNPSTVKLKYYGEKECIRSVCWTNPYRKKINEMWMQRMAKKAEKAMRLKLPKNPPERCQDITVYKGLPMVCCRTCSAFKLFNADRVIVKSFNKDFVKVREIDDKNVEIGEVKEIPAGEVVTLFWPGYCSTLHRQQGQTIREEYTIYQWEKFNDCMKYVAMSRTKFMHHVNIFREPVKRKDESESESEDEDEQEEEYESEQQEHSEDESDDLDL